MRIPSGRTKLCLAIDKVAFAWAMSAIDPMELALVPCADRIPVGRGDLVETSQQFVLWLIQTERAYFTLREVSVLTELTLGHLRYLLTDALIFETSI